MEIMESEERLKEIEERLSGIEWLRRPNFIGNTHLSQHLYLDDQVRSQLRRLSKDVDDLKEEVERIRIAVLRLASKTEVHDLIR